MQDNENNINKIEFNLTSNIFLNSGIVALEHYLNEFKDKTELKYEFELSSDKLIVKCDNLLKLLEDVYYYMGKEIYDTITEKQRQTLENAYYDTKKKEFVRFPKMKTYGLAALLTNDPAPKTKNKDNTKRIEKFKDSNPELVEQFKIFFKKNDLVLLKQLYFNEPYTKINRLEFKQDYLKNGDKTCSLTGEKFVKLEDSQCISPFISGLCNFNSNLISEDKGISWKAKYLSLFSPKLSFFTYTGGLDSIIVYFLNSTNLIDLKNLFNLKLHKDSIQLIQSDYRSNFRIYNWASEHDTTNDYTEQNEFLFMLIYTFYKIILVKNIDIQQKPQEWNPFEESEFKLIPISIISFKADKYASTMRPNTFEYYNNFKFIIRLIYSFERNNIIFKDLLSNLKFLKPSFRTNKNKYRLERQLRNRVLGKFLNLKSVIDEIEILFYDCFKYKMSNEYIPYKDYNNLTKFLIEYEKIIKFGGNIKMNKELQEKSINLGKSIGQGILNAGDDRLSNAKGGRSYLISLRKARTLQQFLSEINRMQFKYNLGISNDILNGINEQNFIYVKQFSLISALNQINQVFNIKQKENKNGTETK